MLCERCHKDLATLRYSEVIDGKAIVKNLCQTCLERLQGDAGIGFEMFGAAPTPSQEFFKRESSDTVPRYLVCRTCGTVLSEALKSGRLGCGGCYETFLEELEPVLHGLHPALRHRGKAPHRDESRESQRMDLQTKRALLRSALKTENYEEAAILRDSIKDLEAGLGVTTSQQD